MTRWFLFSFLEKIITKKLAKLVKLMLEKQKIQKLPNLFVKKIAKIFQEINTGMTLLVYSSIEWFFLL
jgi:hypothetical protein